MLESILVNVISAVIIAVLFWVWNYFKIIVNVKYFEQFEVLKKSKSKVKLPLNEWRMINGKVLDITTKIVFLYVIFGQSHIRLTDDKV